MTPQQQIFFENTSSEIFETMLKKVRKLTEKHGHEMGFAILANVGQLSSGMALSLYIETENQEEALKAHKSMSDAIWNSAQNYASRRARSK